MKKLFCVLIVVILLVSVTGCAGSDDIQTPGTLIRKEILDSNQYYFYVEYEIEGQDGIYEATIKVRNAREYNDYEIGDIYMFGRPAN